MPNGFKCAGGVCQPPFNPNDRMKELYGSTQGINPDEGFKACVFKGNLPTPECPDCSPIVCIYVPNQSDFADPVSCTASP